jgi:hypothetical protein
MDTITATVTGARHLRVARNGQDAAAAASGPGWAAAAVCDGCSAGAYSEVGARLGAALVVAALARRLAAEASEVGGAGRGVGGAGREVDGAGRGVGGAGREVDGAGREVGGGAERDFGGATREVGGVDRERVLARHAQLWAEVRAEVVRALTTLVDRMGGDRVKAVVDHFLFTIVAVAATREGASVCAIGDGTYAFDGETRVRGPFADNQPPYLGYALLGDDPPAHVEAVPAGTRVVAIGTDGATELPGGLARFTEPRYLAHADRARRELAVLARGREVIEWDERRVVRTAELHDDCAIAVVRLP